MLAFNKTNPILCVSSADDARPDFAGPSSLAIDHARQALPSVRREYCRPVVRGMEDELVLVRLAMRFGTRDTCIFRK